MSCFPCFDKQKYDQNAHEDVPVAQAIHAPGNLSINAFTFRELAYATKSFRQECLLGEDGFGRIYKGTLQPNSKVISVKQLDRNGTQGNKEFQAEVATLSVLRHKNLVELIGYCADGDQRLLVYEFMTQGALDSHLLDIPRDKQALDWKTRMKIAEGVAQGLEYLHEMAKPPVVYRDLKSSNVMLDDEFNAKLFDYGLAKIGQSNEDGKMLVSSRVIGTYGYCAPEYERSGELTLKSDIYSFGVVLLELVTGRRAIDTTQPTNDQNLVTWAQPYFKNPKRFPEMADPNLQNQYPLTDLNQVVGVAAMCIQEEPMVRPLIGDILAALSCLKLVGENLITPPATSTNPHTTHTNGNEDMEDEERTSSGDTSTDYSDEDEDEDEDKDEDEEGGGEEMSAIYKKWREH